MKCPEYIQYSQMGVEEPEDELEDSDSAAGIRRQLPNISGVYVDGQVNGVEVVFTINSSASETMISQKVFEQIQE